MKLKVRKKAIYIFFLIVISVLSLAYLIMSYRGQSSFALENKVKADSLEKELSSSQFLIADYRDRMKISYENDRIPINGYDTIITNGKEILLKSILKENRVFVRISSSNCWNCIKSISQCINKEDLSIDDIVYLLEAQDESSVERLIQYAKIKKPVYITKSKLNLPVDSIGEPYFFCVDSENKTRMVMMPIIKDEKLTILYFNILKK